MLRGRSRVARVTGERGVAVVCVVGFTAAVVVDSVGREVVGARVDQRGVVALGVVVAAVAIAGAEAVCVFIDALLAVEGVVAVEVLVFTALGRGGHDLALARAVAGAVRGAGVRARTARAVALGSVGPGVAGLDRQRHAHVGRARVRAGVFAGVRTGVGAPVRTRILTGVHPRVHAGIDTGIDVLVLVRTRVQVLVFIRAGIDACVTLAARSVACVAAHSTAADPGTRARSPARPPAGRRLSTSARHAVASARDAPRRDGKRALLEATAGSRAGQHQRERSTLRQSKAGQGHHSTLARPGPFRQGRTRGRGLAQRAGSGTGGWPSSAASQ